MDRGFIIIAGLCFATCSFYSFYASENDQLNALTDKSLSYTEIGARGAGFTLDGVSKLARLAAAGMGILGSCFKDTGKGLEANKLGLCVAVASIVVPHIGCLEYDSDNEYESFWEYPGSEACINLILVNATASSLVLISRVTKKQATRLYEYKDPLPQQVEKKLSVEECSNLLTSCARLKYGETYREGLSQEKIRLQQEVEPIILGHHWKYGRKEAIVAGHKHTKFTPTTRAVTILLD